MHLAGEVKPLRVPADASLRRKCQENKDETNCDHGKCFLSASDAAGQTSHRGKKMNKPQHARAWSLFAGPQGQADTCPQEGSKQPPDGELLSQEPAGHCGGRARGG